MMKGRTKVVRRFSTRQGFYVLLAIALFSVVMILLLVFGGIHID
jgi:hypothetical protein